MTTGYRIRPSTAQRGYGAAHRAMRRRLLARWRPGDPCARCGWPMYGPASMIDLGHTDDRAGWTGLEHARCNRGAPRRGKRFPWEAERRRMPRRW